MDMLIHGCTGTDAAAVCRTIPTRWYPAAVAAPLSLDELVVRGVNVSPVVELARNESDSDAMAAKMMLKVLREALNRNDTADNP